MISRIVLYVDYDFDIYKKGGAFTRINSINEQPVENVFEAIRSELFNDMV